MADQEVTAHGAAMKEVTKPRTKAAQETKVQMNFRLTEWLRWKIYRYAKQHKIGQSEAVRRIMTEFFTEDDVESDWRAKL